MSKQIKCPLCTHQMSELRDICPECLTDLRPAKHKVGLTISNPTASYEALLAKTTGKTPTSPITKAVGGLFDSLSSILSGNPIERSSVELPVPLPATPPPTPPQTPAQEVSATNRPSNATHTSIIPSASAAPLATPRAFDPLELNAPSTQAIAAQVQTLIDRSTDVSALFQAALVELAALPTSGRAELSLANFQSAPKTEEVELLFELADETFLDPAVNDRYSDKVFLGETAAVPSEYLRAELEKVERSLNSQNLSLREMQRLQAARLRYGQTAISTPERSFEPLRRGQRSLAYIIDITACVCLALISALIVVGGIHPSFWMRVLDGSWNLTHVLSVAMTFIPLLIALPLIYRICTVSLLGTTLGREVAGVAFRNSRGTRCARSQVVIRDLSAPALFVLGGWIALLTGRSGPAEILADCFPVAEHGDEQPIATAEALQL